VVLAAALVAGGLAVCSRGSGGPGTSNPSPRVLLPTSPTALPQYDPDQFQTMLAQLKGKPVVVNVWASWCGPCKLEAPELAKVSRQFDGRVQFVAVDIEDQLPAARQFITTAGWSYPSVFDPPAAIRNDLGFIGQPVTVVYDATGHRVKAYSGATTARLLSTELSTLV